jgi:hypothetical protein
MGDWLDRLRHDVVKRALWALRDLRAVGITPAAVDRTRLAAGLLDLIDDEGRPATASALWATFKTEAPAVVPATTLQAFEAALISAEAAARTTGPIAELIAALEALERAFADLARVLPSSQPQPR